MVLPSSCECKWVPALFRKGEDKAAKERRLGGLYLHPSGNIPSRDGTLVYSLIQRTWRERSLHNCELPQTEGFNSRIRTLVIRSWFQHLTNQATAPERHYPHRTGPGEARERGEGSGRSAQMICKMGGKKPQKTAPLIHQTLQKPHHPEIKTSIVVSSGVLLAAIEFGVV